jgi:Fe-S-cluster-containing dehydrogenase component
VKASIQTVKENGLKTPMKTSNEHQPRRSSSLYSSLDQYPDDLPQVVAPFSSCCFCSNPACARSCPVRVYTALAASQSCLLLAQHNIMSDVS